jgi:hypothetical protein
LFARVRKQELQNAQQIMHGVTTALGCTRIEIIERAPWGPPVLQPSYLWSGRAQLHAPHGAALVSAQTMSLGLISDDSTWRRW